VKATAWAQAWARHAWQQSSRARAWTMSAGASAADAAETAGTARTLAMRRRREEGAWPVRGPVTVSETLGAVVRFSSLSLSRSQISQRPTHPHLLRMRFKRLSVFFLWFFARMPCSGSSQAGVPWSGLPNPVLHHRVGCARRQLRPWVLHTLRLPLYLNVISLSCSVGSVSRDDAGGDLGNAGSYKSRYTQEPVLTHPSITHSTIILCHALLRPDDARRARARR
jgi:hypothetical protein